MGLSVPTSWIISLFRIASIARECSNASFPGRVR